jgi:hypothetical protein
VIIDATECETERPKKAKESLLRQEKAAHHKGPYSIFVD